MILKFVSTKGASACVLSRFSHVQLFVTLRTIAHQAPLSMVFSRKEYWSGLSCPPSGDLPSPGIKTTSLMSPALTDGFFTTRATCLLFSCSVVSSSLWPHGLQHIKLPCPSLFPGACSNLCPSSQWCHPTISSSHAPFSSCLQSFPASGSFPVSQFFASGGQSIGASASASILPMNIQDWFPLGLTYLISLQSRGLSSLLQYYSSKASVFDAQPSLWSNSHTIWEDHKRWIAEGNCFFTKSRINCISLEKRYLYLCTKFMFTSGTPFKKMNKDTPQVKAGLGPIIPLLLVPLQPCMPSCRFCCTLCKLPHQGLCTCSCLFHLMCSWWKCAHGSPAPFLGSWLKEHLFRRACSGHSTPNIIIHFLSPFLFYFSSSHCLLFYFIHQEYTTYLCISVLQHLEE